ncbi:M24 family metallopeptidase [Desulfitobacterium chlororespirans]|uniref:Xaa-Pro aminopeptidase n=1 Tax=Desulfitobacterium chlororespirans DSM 11544 TaxID=1121395 RepID=A0A1M7SC24_9FIRM|nr:Xaa-Pro peptidase family protein [Desulfitobacterium chlororespirans]SHN56005.1 Xaa-Pro aminopeptidase [Desulfitobacterium chlororespirans DSM 11544]
MFSKSEYERRLKGFQAILAQQEIDGALLVQRADTLYFTGTAQNLHLYIPQAGQPLLLVYRNMERVLAESPWEAFPLTGMSKLPELISEHGHPLPQVMGLEYDVLPVANYLRYAKIFSQTRLVDISYPLRLFRAVKSAEEIARLEENGRVYAQLLEYASTVLRPGMTEIELEGLLEAKARMLGHETMLRTRAFGFEFHFGGVVAGPQGATSGYFDGPVTGLGASYAHPLGPSHTPIQAGDMVMMDLVIAQEGYQVDATRMLVIGEPSQKMAEAYQISCEIQERARLALIPGRKTGDVYAELVDWVERETPYAENFMGYGQNRVRFIGHGVGLELDELPTISKGAQEILAPGMTIAVEPKFIFPGEGAVGVEDTLVIAGEKGARFLTHAPKSILRV